MPKPWWLNVSPPSFGVPIEKVRVITGDTDNTPYGGGTWASRAAGIGGEAAAAGRQGTARQRARRGSEHPASQTEISIFATELWWTRDKGQTERLRSTN